MKINFTNKNRLGFFRDTYKVGYINLTDKAKQQDLERIKTMSNVVNSFDIEAINESISEIEFYTLYLTLLSTANKLRNKESLTPVQITYLAYLMAKPLDYTISTNSKSNKITELAKELNKTPQSFYNALNKLKLKNWVYISEDSTIMLQSKLQGLRTIIKTQLKQNNVAIWDTLFRYVITD
jgi:DNA-binding MarR family transcriptional regulator